MFARLRAAGLIWPAVMTLVMLPVLIGLGTWQWQRLAWKQDLIAKLDARRTGEASSYAHLMADFVRTGDVEYRRVRVTGTFDHTQERHVYAPTQQAQGWHVYTLMKPEGGLPPLFVNRGWVPATLKDASKRAEGQVAGVVTLTGLVRLPEVKGAFTPAHDAKTNSWYARDIEAMRWGTDAPPPEAAFASTQAQAYAPFAVEAEAEPANPGGWPRGGVTELRLPNSHLQYVVTWYGLALTLAVIFGVYARQRLAAPAPPVQP